MRSGRVETGLNRGVQKQMVNPVPTLENESKYKCRRKKYETYRQSAPKHDEDGIAICLARLAGKCSSQSILHIFHMGFGYGQLAGILYQRQTRPNTF
jgi:hypothetical protein